MEKPKLNFKLIRDYEERRDSLLRDGYQLRHETMLSDGYVARLHHMANGNDVVLIARGINLIQKTNRVIVHEAIYV